MKLLEKLVDWLIDVPYRVKDYLEKITEFKVTDAIKQMLRENKKNVKFCNKHHGICRWRYVRKFLNYRIYSTDDTEYTLLKLGFIEFFYKGIYYLSQGLFVEERRAYIVYDLRYKGKNLTVMFPIGQKVMFIADDNCTVISKQATKLKDFENFYAHLRSATTDYEADTRKGNISLIYSYLNYKLKLEGFVCSYAIKGYKHMNLKLEGDKIPSDWDTNKLDKFVEYVLGKYRYPTNQNLIALDYTQYDPIDL